MKLSGVCHVCNTERLLSVSLVSCEELLCNYRRSFQCKVMMKMYEAKACVCQVTLTLTADATFTPSPHCITENQCCHIQMY